MYFELYKLLMKYPGHVLCIAEAKDLGSQDEKDPELMHVFGRIGRKPAGQKGMPYKFHTIIYMIQKGRENARSATSRTGRVWSTPARRCQPRK